MEFNSKIKTVSFFSICLILTVLIFCFYGFYSHRSLFPSSISNSPSDAILYINYPAKEYFVGNSFDASLNVDAQTSINAISATLSFPQEKLEIANISKDGSIIDLWPEEISFSNQTGTISFSGVILNPGFSGSNGKVIKITFRVKATGKAEIRCQKKEILANDGNGTELNAACENTVLSLESRSFDLNSDGTISLSDFSVLIYNWGTPKNKKADLNNDGKVNLIDFSILAARYIR